MFFRQILNESSSCASYIVGCKTSGDFAVVEPHTDLIDRYIEIAESQGARISAVLDTHIQADHVSGAAELASRTGAPTYLPPHSGASFPHLELADGESVRLGNTELVALATPGHAPAHNAYLAIDHRRSPEPWLVFTGDALLVGDAGRPDLHADDPKEVRDLARAQYHSLTEKLLGLPDGVVVCPSHFAGSACGRGLSATPVSTIGFERSSNAALRPTDEDSFVDELLKEIPAPPEDAQAIVAANLAGTTLSQS